MKTSHYLRAIKKMPSKFVHDETRIANVGDILVAVNQNFKPIQYDKKTRKWTELGLPKGTYVTAKVLN